MESVYLETTVIGNIAGRLHPDPRVSVRQQITREWWATARERYRLVASQITVAECRSGDARAAEERLAIIRGVEVLAVSDEVEKLSQNLIAARAVPASQPRDALHIGYAAVYGVELLVTWNFKHILNPHLQNRIEQVCKDAGKQYPVI